MKIAYYCQHVLGIGHFHRSLEICRALSSRHQVTLIVGGPEVHPVPAPITTFRLPGLQMDSNFQNLSPVESDQPLEMVKENRRKMLFNFFQSESPDVFLVELYPFGRKAFRFELDPVLAAIKKRELPPCRCYVSLRDILVERPDDQKKFEERAVTTLNSYFDGLLIHADEKVIHLEQTFSRFADISVPHAYTGFITPRVQPDSRDRLRQTLSLDRDDMLIVASIGGGGVGGELLKATIDAFSRMQAEQNLHLQVFTGPYFPENTFRELAAIEMDRMRVSRFTDTFPQWLMAADLSISMGGYNTTMNVVSSGVPAIIYPFRQNSEQRTRAEKLQSSYPLEILWPNQLGAAELEPMIRHMLRQERATSPVKIDGAEQSLRIIEDWQP